MKISEPFKQAIQKTNKPLYLLALKVGFHPSRLSRIKNNEEVRRPHDIRFQLLADFIGFRGDLFDCENENASRSGEALNTFGGIDGNVQTTFYCKKA
jgi:hypothetical protein